MSSANWCSTPPQRREHPRSRRPLRRDRQLLRAGPGIAPAAPGRPAKSRQSARNYPHQLAQRLGLDLVDVTSSGATIQDVLRSTQPGQPPQITQITADTALVTVTIGGNDVGYLPRLITAAMPAWLTELPSLGRRLHRFTRPSHADDRLTRTIDAVAQVFTAIRDRAPNARIICLDYLTVLPPSYQPNLPFDQRSYNSLIELAGDLKKALAHASATHDVDLVAASTQSTAHHAWSDQPWTTRWAWPRPGGQLPFHPNADGMTAVTDMITHQLTAQR